MIFYLFQQICICSASFIHLCDWKWLDEDVVVYLKSLRVLLNRGYLSLSIQSGSILQIDPLLALANRDNPFIKYQLEMLLNFDVTRNTSVASDLVAADTLLETVMAGADSRINEFDIGSAALGIEKRIASAVSLISVFDHHLLTTSQVNVMGYPLPVQIKTKASSTLESSHGFVHTATVQQNMAQLAEALHTFQPIILHGVSGAGKSSMIHEFARLLQVEDDLVVLHVSDQTDCKALIGSYACTNVPGEFIWIPGIITTAATNGQWVVVEDIDQVPLEFISLIAPLLESRRFFIPALGIEIVAHHNFRVFATRNLHATSYRMLSTSVDASSNERQLVVPQLYHYSRLWYNVVVHPVGLKELRSIIGQLYPFVFESLIELLLAALYGDISEAIEYINMREVLKIVERIGTYSKEYHNLSGYVTDGVKVMAWKELIEVLVLKCRNTDQLVSMAFHYAFRLGLHQSDVEEQFRISPQLSIHPSMNGKSSVKIGRSSMDTDVEMALRNASTSSSSYSQTAYARRLLERLSVCVSMNEPVLLVGETGNGKTTNVQELARIVGQQLVVLNLSLSSDISDLLGGYRPMSTKQLFKPVYERFVALFHDTLSSSKNNEFLQKTNAFFRDQSWNKLLKAIEKACQSALAKLTQASKDSSFSNIEGKLEQWNDYLKTITRYRENLGKIKSGFAFSFVRGLLLEAFEHGYWILLDEINLASAETLQGLSGFLDTKQHSTIVEGHDAHGKPQKIFRHASFRIFAAMNPPTDVCKKELPAALKTRFTEFYVPELLDEDDLFQIVTGFFPGMTDIPASTIVNVYLQCRKAAEERLVDGSGQKPHYSLRTLTRSLKCALSFLSINLRPMSRCLFEGFYLNFGMMLNEKSQAYMFEFLKDSLWTEDNKKDMSFPPQRPRTKNTNWVLVRPFWISQGTLEPVDWSAKDSIGVSKFVLTSTVAKYIRSIAAAIAVSVAPILLQGPTSIGKTSMIQFLAAKVGRKCVRINNHEHTDIQEYVGGYVTDTDGRLVFKDGLLVEALRNGYWIILDELNLAPSDILEALNRLLDDNQELLITETGELVKPADGFQLFATQNPPGIYGGRKPLSLAFRNRFIEIHMGDLPNSEIEEIIAQSCGIAPKFSAMMVKTMEELQMHRQQSALLLGKHGMITTRDLIKWGKRQPQSSLDVAYMGFMLLGEKLRTVEEQSLVEKVLRDVCKIKESSISISSLIGEKAGVPPFMVEASSSLHSAQEQIRGSHLNLDGVKGIAITNPIVRMWTLLCEALKNSEPVLLVGETGCGKTMVCQLYAAFMGLPFRAVNCHQSTETADLIGGLRPVRSRDGIKSETVRLLNELYAEGLFSSISLDVVLTAQFPLLSDIEDAPMLQLCQYLVDVRDQVTSATLHQKIYQISALALRFKSLFEWVNGPLIDAMKSGDFFLLDEINLAEDAVIERLNSVLEFTREITLAEKGGHNAEQIVANPNFRIVATMNPSGDFGKRELSPALRSRFTEVWIPASNSFEDFASIISEVLRKGFIPNTLPVVAAMIEFMKWFNQYIASYIHGFVMTIRELIAWSDFVNISRASSEQQVYACMVHGAFLSLLDGIGIGHNISRDKVTSIKLACLECLLSLCPAAYRNIIEQSATFLILPCMSEGFIKPHYKESHFVIGDYRLPIGPESISRCAVYATDAPTTLLNLGRIARAMSIKRPILLEGPPGVGKTSIITNLAALTGHKLVRINLSEHTELSDLLGSDLPCQDGGSAGPLFKWYDGTLLKAMKEGSWVLLDELNLAPQTVLEGLNACFDHREQVYLPDIGQTVQCSPSFRVFTAQNPMTEGGGRKGLPASFLSRFTRVFMESLTTSDITRILITAYSDDFNCLHSGPESTNSLIVRMVDFVDTLHRDIVMTGKYGRQGSPWEFNLRDMLRWCDSICYCMRNGSGFFEAIIESAYLLFVLRMRSESDRGEVCRVFLNVFSIPLTVNIRPSIQLSRGELRIGRCHLVVSENGAGARALGHSFHYDEGSTFQQFLHSKPMEALLHSVSLGLPVLVVGKQGSGRRSSIELLGRHLGIDVRYFTATPSLDTSEMLGAFEQSNKDRSLNRVISSLETHVYDVIGAVIRFFPNDSELIERMRSLLSKMARLVTTESSDQTVVIINEVMSSVLQLKTSIDAHEYYSSLRPNFASFATLLESEHISNSINDIEYGFVWLNGVIVDAMERGNWVIFDNVNLCSSSVLDRLNSVLESNGELILNEDGTGRKVERHKNFRIFLVMDPGLGEVSRAMRNRCVELFYSRPHVINQSSETLQCHGAMPVFVHQGDTRQSYLTSTFSSLESSTPLSRQQDFGLVLLKSIRRDNIVDYLDQSALSSLYQSDLVSCLRIFLTKYMATLENSYGSFALQLYEHNRLLVDSFVTEFDIVSLSKLISPSSVRAFLLAQLSMSQSASLIEKLVSKEDKQIMHILLNASSRLMRNLGSGAQDIADRRIFNYLLLESRACVTVNEHLQFASSSPYSLYSISFHVHKKDIVPDNRDLILVGYLWPILCLTEGIMSLTVSRYGTEEALSGCCNLSVGYLVMHVCQMRTLLVQTLMSHSAESPLQGSFWSILMIVIKWMEKSLSLLINYDAQHERVVNQDLKDATKHALKTFHDHYCLFWDNTLVSVKLTLWKQGGHSSVPLHLSDWDVQGTLLNLFSRFSLSLPNFLDHGVDGAISTLPTYRSAALGEVISEWLALLCTFTWQSTNELSINLKSAIKGYRHEEGALVNYFRALIDTIAQKLNAAMILPPDMPRIEARSEMQDILCNQNALNVIRAELKNRVVLTACFYADLIVLDLTEQLISWLSDCMLSSKLQDKSNLRSTIVLLKHIIRLGIFHSTYHPRLFRPFKAMLWALEYVLLQVHPGEEVLLDVTRLLQSYLVEIGGSMYLMQSANIVNNASHLDMSFGSPTLAFAIGNVENNVAYTSPYQGKSEIKGTLAYAHSVSMPFALRHIDMQLLCEKMTSLHSMFARSAHATEVTIASYFRVKTAVCIAFKCSVAKNMLCSKPSVSTSRLAVMLRDVLCCSQHLFLPECCTSFEQVMLEGDFYGMISIVGSSGILDKIADNQFRELFKRCLGPLLHGIIGMVQREVTQEDFSFWIVCLAVLKLHLLLASLFSDPALRAQQKHSLLLSAMQEVKTIVNLNVAHKLIAEDCVFSEEIIGHLKLLEEYKKKDAVHQQKIIERPASALPYDEMFSFLKNLVAGPLSSNTILDFSSSLHALYLGLRYSPSSLKGIDSAKQQEIQLQSMIYSCVERLDKEFYHYQDVTSVFVDCFSVISQGIRSLLSSTANLYSCHKLGRKVNLSCVEAIHQHSWSMMLSTSVRSVECSLSEYYASFLQPDGLLKQYWHDALRQRGVSEVDAASFIDCVSKLMVFSKTELLHATQQARQQDTRDVVNNIFEAFSSHYLNIARDKKAAKQQQASLYTHRKASVESGAEEGIDDDMRELRENFPTYTEELDRVVTSQDDNEIYTSEVTVDSSCSVGQKLKQWTTHFIQDDTNLLYIISFHLSTLMTAPLTQSKENSHQSLSDIDKNVEKHYQYVYFAMKQFEGFEGKTASGLTDRLKLEEMFCYRSFHDFLEECVTDKISHDSIQSRYLIDRDLLYLLDPLSNHRSDRSSDSSYNPWNFHFESNVAEALAANPTLNNILQRAISLLQVLPNNDVLHRIIKLTHAISQFSVSTPLGKLFQSLQVLLKCIQQYEEFAHSKISFSAELSSIFQLMHRYHALQIKSWQSLLRHQEIKYVKTAAMFWFSLHKVFIQDSLAMSKRLKKYKKDCHETPWKTLAAHTPSWLFCCKSMEEDSSAVSQQADKYIFSQIKVMETFLMDSNVGEFPTRLHLVRYVAAALESEMEGSCFLQRLQSLVVGLWYTYSYYLPIVRDFQLLLLGPLQQQVKDEVKMSKWDNITIVAMLENTEKAHRKLQRFIKQYKEDALEYPVRRLIFRENMKDIVSDAGETIDVVQVPLDSVLFPTVHKLVDSSNLSDTIIEFCELYGGVKESHCWQANDVSTVLEVIDKAYPNCHRVDKITIKASRLISASIGLVAEQVIDDPFALSSVCVGINAAVILEDRSDTIFERIGQLRSKTATRPQKQKAFRDLLDVLKEEGFSHLRSELPKNIGNLMETISLGSNLQNRLSHCLSHSFATSSINSSVSTLFQRAESYFVKSLSEITQLRVQYGSASHGDVSNLEKIHMMTFSESMLYATIKLRCSIESGIASSCGSYDALHSLSTLRDYLSSYTSMPTIIDSYIPFGTLKSLCEENVELLRAVVTDMFTAMSVLEFAGKQTNLDNVDVDMEAFASCSPSQMKPLADAIRSMRVDILECVRNCTSSNAEENLATVTDNIQIFARSAESALVSIDKLALQTAVAAKCIDILGQYKDMLEKVIGGSKLSFIVNSLHQVAVSADPCHASGISSASLEDISNNINKIIEKIMLSIQNMNTLHTVLAKGGSYKNDLHGCFNELLLPANQVLPEDKPITTLLSWTEASLAFTCAGGLPRLTKNLTEVLSSLIAPPSESVVRALHLLLVKVCDMVSMHAKAYTALIDQNVFAYKSLSKFLYINVRIFRNLLSKGFCSAESKEDDGEGDGQGSGPTDWGEDQDGTGMGEGEGKKDVSDQITNEEQLLDLKKNLEQNEAGTSKPEKSSEKLDKEEQDKGVEMDQDFEGDMFNMDNTQENKEDEENDDEESIDREMDHDDEEINMDNVVSEKQWGDSDDEDDDDKGNGKEKFERNSSMKGPALPDEMRTKEDEDEEGGGKDDAGKEKEQQACLTSSNIKFMCSL
ncbi:hypothetical protein EON65_07835 [archaeon]|nr:MAG: hypothetical protein EON65_07835 [archaeon]